jgi:hypothetical protein
MIEIKRDSSGNVKVDGEYVCRIPGNQSVFSIFGKKGVVNGGDYTVDDLWIYVDGKPVRKQFVRVAYQGGVNPSVDVWKPNLQDLKRLEARYSAQRQRQRKFHRDVWLKAYKDIENSGGKAHCKVTHKFAGDGDPWWLYNVSNYGIGFTWVSTPAHPINQELGEAFYKADNRSSVIYGRTNMFRNVLEHAFILFLDAKTGSKHGCLDRNSEWQEKQVSINVNKKKYWYYAQRNKFDTFCWEILSWPEDEPRELTA